MRHSLLAAAVLLGLSSAHASDQTESGRLNAFFEQVFERDLARDPLLQMHLGADNVSPEWPDLSEARRIENAALVREDLNRLHRFDYDALDGEAKLSYRLFEYNAGTELSLHKWRHQIYELSHRSGYQWVVPHSLMNDHKIASVADAEFYIARMASAKNLLLQLIEELKRDAHHGTMMPRFVYGRVADGCEGMLDGAPFKHGDKDSAIWADFKKKLSHAGIDGEEGDRLLAEGRAALLSGVGEGYHALIAYLRETAPKAPEAVGVWQLENGQAFYRAMLGWRTTVSITAEEVHETGLEEVKRIHGEMRVIMEQVGFEGELSAFFDHLRTGDEFYYPTTDEGRAAYMDHMRKVLDEVDARTGEILHGVPDIEIALKRVEPWLEKSAGIAGYYAPPKDGSRPGLIYINQVDMKRLPIYEISALAYHEGIPGHHTQQIMRQALEGVPQFRSNTGYTAFSEGWALYAEDLPGEIGFYRDAYQDFGRLSMALMRAGRLVVDSGIHAKGWSREQAVAWLDANTPIPHAQNVVAVDRYSVLPGQATAYSIGRLKMYELREYAKDALGAKFSLPAFNTELLRAGPVPLSVLEENISVWVKKHE
ncbi:DUF885 domain-containing protein [Kordiimonas aestuarii]|uniref:DUF885 domain-containing protein n=1 Tax=Kordiimonas aestuarii TaxID=1005925 RepID=UPI0021CF5F66|nr:DUF885 domain-containing protein [Kordiimonas aestuarii]